MPDLIMTPGVINLLTRGNAPHQSASESSARQLEAVSASDEGKEAAPADTKGTPMQYLSVMEKLELLEQAAKNTTSSLITQLKEGTGRDPFAILQATETQETATDSGLEESAPDLGLAEADDNETLDQGAKIEEDVDSIASLRETQ